MPPAAESGTETLTGRLRAEAGQAPMICSGGSCTVRGQLSLSGVEFAESLRVTAKL